MVTAEALGEYVREYAASRFRDPVMTGWVGGSLGLLATMYITSSGRRMVQAAPPPKVRFISKTIEKEKPGAAEGGDGTAPPKGDSTVSSPASPDTRAAALSDAISAATAAVTSRSAQHPEDVSMARRFLQLLRIAIPSSHGREAREIALLFALMFTRAFVSVRIVDISGVVSSTAIEGNLRKMFKALLAFGLSCVPAALLNVTLDYYFELLELHFRENVTTYLTDRYLKRRIFFQLAGLHTVDHVDQRITEDASQWAHVAAALFVSVPRPLIEAVMFTYTLYKQTGAVGPTSTWVYYFGFAAWMWFFAPNMDWIVGQRMERLGAFQAAHQDALTHAEEITVTRGFPFYEKLLQRLFKSVTDQARYAAYVHARFGFTEIMYNKYGSVLMGYIICAIAAIRQQNGAVTAEDAASTLTKAAYTFKTLASAIGRLLWNIKLVMVVGGYTRRLTQFVIALDRAEKLAEMQTDRTAHSPAVRGPNEFTPQDGEGDAAAADFENLFGRVVRDEHIEFVDVPLILPTGECLCRSMSFYVKPGMNLLIIGPNGCGKSSTFRLLGELWPLRGGRIIKPEADQLYYVPQRPYMFDGTLLEQVIYPMKKKELTVGESELYGYLQMAGLDYIFTKSNMSWETRLSWSDGSLSLGEQQRLAMARLFFHRPRFAILDECSSLIDLEVEKQIYDHCVELGITVITIAHRRSVWQYHNWILYFDGNGGYMFSPLQYADGDTALVLSCVKSATDETQVGKEVRIPVTDRLCGPEESEEAIPSVGRKPAAAVAAAPAHHAHKSKEGATHAQTNGQSEPPVTAEKGGDEDEDEEGGEESHNATAAPPAAAQHAAEGHESAANKRGRRNRHRKNGGATVRIAEPHETGDAK